LTWCEWHDDYAATATFYFGGANDRGLRIISALHDDVRLEQLHELERCILSEHYDEIDGFDTGKNVSSLALAPHWPFRPFESADRRVAVDADDERVRGFSCREQEINVAGMKQVEDAVGERDSIPSSGSPPLRLFPRCNFRRGIPSLQSSLTGVKPTPRGGNG
jgi:hypothetical protein